MARNKSTQAEKEAFLLCVRIFLFLIVNQAAAEKLSKPAPQVAALKEPKIWLKGYRQMDSTNFVSADNEYRFQYLKQNEFVSKNGTEYVISEKVFTVDFECVADYPITWLFPYPEQALNLLPVQMHAEEYRISEFNPDSSKPINIRYKVLIRMHCLYINFLSLNLTCQSTEHLPNNLKSSIHIFVKAKSKIEHQNETVQVFAKKLENTYGQTSIIIPCRPATPGMKISIQKEVIRGVHDNSIQNKTWEPLLPELQKKLSFNPKIGFTLQQSTNNVNTAFGLYKCSVVDDDEDEQLFVIVNVTSTANNALNNEQDPEFIFQPKAVLHGKATANIEFTHGQPSPFFVCCNGDQSKPPKLFLKYCRNSLECDLIKSAILRDIASGTLKEKVVNYSSRRGEVRTPKDCRRQLMFSDGGVLVVCKGDNVDFVNHFTPSFHPLAGGSVVNRTYNILKSNLSQHQLNDPKTRFLQYVNLDKYESAAVLESDDNVARKAILFVGEKVNWEKRSFKLFGHFGDGRTGYEKAVYGKPIHLETGDIEDSYNMEQNYDYDISGSRHNPNPIMEYSRDFYYEGEPILYICIGLRYIYAKGGYIRLNWKNGTKTLLAKPASTVDSNTQSYFHFQVLHLCGNAILNDHGNFNNDPIFGRTVVAASDMSSVDCWLPKRKSNKWDRVTKEIKIVPSVAPVFAENKEEAVYFYVGDAGNILSCTLKNGVPWPTLSVTRNGNLLQTSFRKLVANDNETESNNPKVGTSQIQFLNETLDVTGLKIYFSEIEHGDHASVFQCIAVNINTTVTRTIKIYVSERSRSVLVPVTLSCLIVLGFVLVALGIKYWYNKGRAR